MSLFDAFLQRLISIGRLSVVGADGRLRSFGPGGPPAVRVRLRDARTQRRLLMNPELCLGEAYMDGSLVIEDGSLEDLLVLCTSNARALERHPLGVVRGWLGRLARFIQQYNPAPRARANVAHHYDLSGALYQLFLDRDLQYS